MRLFNNYMAPTDTVTEPSGITKDGILDILNTDEPADDLLTETKLAKKEAELEEKEEETEKEELELEGAEEEPEPDEIELVTPVKRKDILKKYPELFKDFPYLEKAMYREQQYTELLPTLDDARELVDKVKGYENFESSLLSGSTEEILKTVRDTDKQAFNSIVDNYLPTLAKVDQQAYYHVAGNIIKNTIVAMVREGTNLNNDKLKEAAVLINQFVFGSSDFQAPTDYGPKKQDNGESEKLQTERQEFIRERFESVRDDLHSKTQNSIKATIAAHIDPKGMMTDYVKKTATKDALEQVESLIQDDTRFKNLLDKLWEKAFTNKFNKASIDAIRSAYLNKAKTLLPSAIQQSRNTALKGLGKRVTEDREEPTRKGPVTVGRATANTSGSKTEIKKGEKTLDYFMRD